MEEAEQHINCLELKAAILALKKFSYIHIFHIFHNIFLHTGTTPESGQPFFKSYTSKNGQYNHCGLCEQEVGTQSPSLEFNIRIEWMLRTDVFGDIAHH